MPPPCCVGRPATAECPLSGVKRTLIGRAPMSAFDPKRTQCGPLEQVRCQRRRFGTPSWPSTLGLWHPCHGDDVMDRNNRVGRRERFEILKIAQDLGAGTVAVDKGSLRPLRPHTILGALEESIARRTRAIRSLRGDCSEAGELLHKVTETALLT